MQPLITVEVKTVFQMEDFLRRDLPLGFPVRAAFFLCRSPTLHDWVPQDGIPSFGRTQRFIAIQITNIRSKFNILSMVLQKRQACCFLFTTGLKFISSVDKTPAMGICQTIKR